jgi:hypothetical protein
MSPADVSELKDRIIRSMRGHANDDYRACCWQGYVAALLEWGLISPNTHDDLMNECSPSSQADQTNMIFLDHTD